MTLARKIEQVLKDELKPENIRTVIELTEFLKFKESQKRWSEINEAESEYLAKDEKSHLEEVKLKGEFIDQADLLKELELNKDEISD